VISLLIVWKTNYSHWSLHY